MLKFGISRNSQKSSEYEGGTMSDDDVWKKASGRGKPGPKPSIPRGVPGQPPQTIVLLTSTKR